MILLIRKDVHGEFLFQNKIYSVDYRFCQPTSTVKSECMQTSLLPNKLLI